MYHKSVYILCAGLAFWGLSCRSAHDHKKESEEIQAKSTQCESEHNHDEHEGHNHEGHDHGEYEDKDVSTVAAGNTITFSKVLQSKIKFKIEKVEPEFFGTVIRTVAQVQPFPGDEKDAIAKADGVVVFPQRAIADGSIVKNGQVVISIECGGLADNNMHTRYNEVSNRYTQAKSEYERKTPLYKDKIVSESEWLQSKTEYENASSEYSHLRENFSADRQIVKAPINGYIRELVVRNGEFVSKGQRLFTVTQNRKSLLKAEVSPRKYSYLKDISTAVFKEINGNTSYTLEQLKGRLVSYGHSSSLESPLIPIVFEIEAVNNWIPGMFVNVYIRTKGNSKVLTVSNGAIVEEMGNYFVFVRLTAEVFEKRQIVKGGTDGLKTEVKEGLSSGENVVSQGAVSVKLAQGSAALDPHSGHAH